MPRRKRASNISDSKHKLKCLPGMDVSTDSPDDHFTYIFEKMSFDAHFLFRAIKKHFIAGPLHLLHRLSYCGFVQCNAQVGPFKHSSSPGPVRRSRRCTLVPTPGGVFSDDDHTHPSNLQTTTNHTPVERHDVTPPSVAIGLLRLDKPPSSY